MWVRTDRPPNCGGPSGRTTRRAEEKAAPSDTSTWLRRLRDSCVPLASLVQTSWRDKPTRVSAVVSTSLRDRLDGPALTEPSMPGRLLRPGTRGSMRGMGEDVRGTWSARSSAAGELPRCRRKAMDWTFGGLWPYEPPWFDSDDGRMHYVDEGPRDGRPV